MIYTEDVKLRPEVKSAWVGALRSGAYKQGKGALVSKTFSADGTAEGLVFCCLGVLCDVAIKMGLDLARKESSYDIGYGSASGTAVLPDEVVRWAFEDGKGAHDPVANGFALSGWNDAKDADFVKIADLVEDYL